MYKLYEVKKTKSQIRGYWLNNGRLYKDNIYIKSIKDNQALRQDIQALFGKNELSIFYTQGKRAYIQDKQGKVNTLYKRLRLHRHKLSISEIKRLLKHFGGLTVYKLIDRHIIEVYYN